MPDGRLEWRRRGHGCPHPRLEEEWWLFEVDGERFDVAVGYLNADLKAGLREIDRLCREKLPNAESEWFRPPN